VVPAKYRPAVWQLIAAVVPSSISPSLIIQAQRARRERSQPATDLAPKSLNNLPLLC
jgi:hypothetical protein